MVCSLPVLYGWLLWYNFYMQFLDPAAAIAQIAIPQNGVVADFGAGAGYVAVALAERVGEDGTVYVIDIQQELLTKVTHLAQKEHIDTFEYIHADLEEPRGTGLSDSILDAVIISNVLFQVSEKGAVLAEAFRVLKKGGILLVVDWRDSFGNMGPTGDMVLSEEDARTYIISGGFTVVEDIDVGAYHYGIVATK
jgi:ubiquinone/menaquinone biosynthesis C-methylase UbiE